MSVFDQSFHISSGCLSICNENVDRLSPIPALLQQHQQEDDLMPSAVRQEKREIDDMLSQAMKGLSFEDRQKQMEILHGVDQKVAEEETFIEASLQQLESQLTEIKSYSVYEMAEQMDPAYVRARAFRMMFLRANRYDVKKSADNMLSFFEMKRNLFGIKKLVKDITLEDLDEDDIAALKTGFVRHCGKDRSGRLLSVNIPGLRGSMSLHNELRMRYYIHMNALKKEENQLSGVVSIVFSVGDMKDRFRGDGFFENAKVGCTVPIYKASVHLCTDEVREYLVHKTVIQAFPLELRSRFRLHFGSQTECLYNLSTYGIPQDILPLDPNTQKVSLKRHLEWVESLFLMERHGRPAQTVTAREQSIINPGENDVLVGTGRRIKTMGNQRLRALVKELSQAYDKGNKEARKGLVDCVINSVKESGGRFLKEHNVDGRNVIWHEMPRDQIRMKVTQAFRNSYRRR